MFSATMVAETNYTYTSEGFEQTGVWPSSVISSEGSYAAATGSWKLNNGYRKTSTPNTGLGYLYINQDGYFITPNLTNGADSVKFYARSSGSGARTITMQKSIDGTTFTDVTTFSVSGTYVLCAYKISGGNAQYIKFIATSGAAQFDDVTITSATNAVVTLSSTVLTNFGNVVIGNTSSTIGSYTVSGVSLSSPLLVTAPANFQVSTDNSTFTSSVSLTPSTIDSSVASTTIYVRFAPLSAAGSVNGTITNVSGIISKRVTVGGIAIAAEPSTQSAITFGTVTGTSAVVNFSGGDGAYRILVARTDTVVSWAPIDGITVNGVNAAFTSAQDQNDGNVVVYAGNGNTVTVTGLSVATKYYFAVYEYNGNVTNSQNYLVVSPGTGNLTTLAVPMLSVDPSSLVFGNGLVDSISSEKVYSLSGSYLLPADSVITVTAPSGFEISTASGTGFTSSLSLPYTSHTLSAISIYIRFHPTSLSTYSGTIDNNGGSASTLSVAVSGAGVDSATFAIQTIYVSPTGDDVTGKGSLDSPYKSVANSALKLRAGGCLILRGGVYNPDSLVIHDATMHHLTFKAYSGEVPIIRHGSYDDIILYASYCTVDGISADSAVHNGIHIMGHYNVIKNCDFHHNGDAGLKLGAHLEYKYPRCDTIINCDAHDNYDSGTNGGNADGFAAKWAIGSGNYFYGCRAWNNGDDGWDLWQADSTIVIENCWCINNGKVLAHPSAAGNGNGFKVGGSPVNVHQEVKNCLSVFGYGSSGGKGFDQNNNSAGHTILNCTAYNNANNDFNFPTATTVGTNIIQNCIAYLSTSKPKLVTIAGGTVTNDSWLTGFSVSASDFVSLDTMGLRGARKSDGSLPDVTFGHLASTSAFINAGVNVGLPYVGSAPDLGCFEYGATTTAVNSDPTFQPRKFQLNQNYPNPFNPSTNISFHVAMRGIATLMVYDVIGREVAELFNRQAEPGMQYTVQFNANRLSSGVYFGVLQCGSQRVATKMLLMK